MHDFSTKHYFERLFTQFGRGWNRFWYTPGDPLPLSLIRVATGLLALYFILTYTPDVSHFFAQDGLLPYELTELPQYTPDGQVYNPATLSYLSHLNTATELNVAHWIGVAILLLFTIGLFSRITAVLGLIVTLSYIHRGPMLTSEIEPVLAMIQFYLCLGPCGARLSVDRVLALRAAQNKPASEKDPGEQKFFSATLATRLIQVHLCLIVAMMGLAKLAGPGQLSAGPEWYDPWGTGEAVWWLLARPQSGMFDTLGFLRDYPKLIAAWTHVIVLFELAFPILVWNRLARPLMLGLALVVWSSLALISGLWVMYALLMVACLSFIEPTLLDRWFKKRSTVHSSLNPPVPQAT